MSIRYVSTDLEWTETMKECVQQKIIGPLNRHLKSDDFELSMHFQSERKRRISPEPVFEMWAVLQTFDGCHNEVVRCEGFEFQALTSEVSRTMGERLRQRHFSIRR